jgi:mRNA-degrading endonuclease RelE of RelBE toxin-antitoxin system
VSKNNLLARSEFFKQQYKKLPKEIQEKVDRALRKLAVDTRYASLETHEVHGASGYYSRKIYEAKVDNKYRLTWEYWEDNKIFLRNVDNHDECFRNP